MTKYDLTIRLPNWVGDTIMSLPAISALQQQGMKLLLVGKPWASNLLHGLKCDINTLPKDKREHLTFWRDLSTPKVLLFTNSFSSALTSRCAGKQNIGFKTDKRGLLVKHKIIKQPGYHEVEYYWQLANKAAEIFKKNIPNTPPKQITLPIHANAIQKADTIMADYQLSDNFILICPMAVGLYNGQSKIWPHWKALINHLLEKGLQVITCPGPGELEQCQSLYPQCTIIEATDLSTLAALCAKAKMVLSNDSGPMHIATATNPNTCGILGVTNPELTRPWGGQYLMNAKGWPSIKDVMQWIEQHGIITQQQLA
jgi:heptosyltransferase II